MSDRLASILPFRLSPQRQAGLILRELELTELLDDKYREIGELEREREKTRRLLGRLGLLGDDDAS